MSTYSYVSLAILTVLSLLVFPAGLFAEDTPAPILITGGTVFDGTGAPGVAADVLIEGDTVKAVGQDIDAEGATLIDANGLFVCPGIVDVHCHAHGNMSAPDDPKSRQVISLVGQGVTTIVVGVDGGGVLDVTSYAEKIRANPRSLNIAQLVGHRAARAAVLLGNPSARRSEMPQREVTPEELEKMAALIEQGMKDGAFGFSTDLERLGDYFTTEEIIACAKAVAPYGGYHEEHLRCEEEGVLDATHEAVHICSEAGIQLCISHIKVATAPMLGKAGEMLDIINKARAEGLTVYENWRPSVIWSSNLKPWFDPDNSGDLTKIDTELRKYWPDADAYLYKCPSHPELVGRTLDKIAEEWQVSPAEALVKIWGFEDALFEFQSMIWEDRKKFLEDPFCIVSGDVSDGLLRTNRQDPLVWTCFPTLFGTMVRDWNWLPMETAVYKCTGLPAKMLGLPDRGILVAGKKADVFIFDPKTIQGEMHWDKWDTRPVGVAYTIVMDHGKHTGALPGRFISKKQQESGKTTDQVVSLQVMRAIEARRAQGLAQDPD